MEMHTRVKVKKMYSVVLTIFLFLGLSACISNIETVSTDYFVFELNHKEKHATITKLTELGKEQEILVFPTVIEEYPVKYIGKSPELPLLGEGMGALALTDVQKKVYLPSSLGDRAWLTGTSERELILLVAHPSNELIESINRFSEAQLYYLDDLTKLNTFFMFNFDSSENEGYYWMDYTNGMNPYIIPADPVREGYVFDGWYYEEECTNLWDNQFPLSETHTLTLFAKWID